MVFRKESAPKKYDDFLNWYDKQIAWTEDHSYDDPANTSPELRNWFMDMIKTFPALNGPFASEDVDSEYVSDYSIGLDVIYVAFPWSVADEAYRTVTNLAIKHSVGFFNVSGEEGELMFPGKDEITVMKKPGGEIPIPSTYRIAKGWEIFIWIVLPVFMVAFALAGFTPFLADQFDLTLALILVPMSVAIVTLCALGLLETYRSKLIIEKDRIVNVLTFDTRTLAFDDIKGFRIGKNYLHFIPKNEKDKKLKISVYIGRYAELLNWASRRFPDLDAEGPEEEQEILNNEELGRTWEEREEKLKRAKKISKFLNIAAWVVGISTFFYPRYYQAQVLLCSLIPILGILLYRNSKGLIRLNEKENSYLPGVAIAIMVPSCILALRAMLDYSVLDYSNFWLPASFVVIVLAFLIFTGSPQKLNLKKADTLGLIFVFVLLAGFYPYGFVVATNAAFDESEPVYYKARILGKSVSKGKTTTYYFELSEWGPQKEVEEVSVSSDIYNTKEVGDSAVIYFNNGVYKLPYYFVKE